MEDTWAKKKKVVSEQELIKKAKSIFDDFSFFTTGYRTLFLIQRHKEGGETHNSRLVKKIARNEKEYLEALTELVKQKSESELPLRIYACVNERDFKKSVRQFKYEMLDADYYGTFEHENFYLDIKNRFLGAMMQPAQRATSYFLFDCDNLEGVDVVGTMLQTIPNEHIIKQYKTKNGWHIITHPFNHTIYDYPSSVEMKKDGLLLLDF